MAGRDPRRKKVRALIAREGMVSLLNDTKWMRVVDALWPLSLRYRAKLVTSDAVSGWEDWISSPVPNYIELPSIGPVLALEIEWLEITPRARRALDQSNADNSDEALARLAVVLRSLYIPFSMDGATVRVVGHQRALSRPR